MFNQGSVVYEANYAATEGVVINQGGTSSGKTYSILQVLFTRLSEQPRLTCTVVGQDIPNLKVGALRDALDIYDNTPELHQLIASYNKSDRIFTWHNGSVMEFKSYDGPQDAKSGKRDYLFVNEANGILFEVWNELYMRTRKQAFIDYNPNAGFWVHEQLVGKPGHRLIISDHTHNPFVPEAVRLKIEGLKDVDKELWRVYARGKTGKVEGLVFRNWELCEEVPPLAKHIGRGLDFGFTNDPTAAVDVYLQNGELWLDEVLYSTGLTNPDIEKRLSEEDSLTKQKQHVGDSAEPKSLEELRRLGLKIEPAKKGPDSIKASIDVLKRYKLRVTRRSVNLRKELGKYKWKVDRATNQPTNEPIDTFNHAIDAVRYVALNKLQLPQGSGMSWGF